MSKSEGKQPQTKKKRDTQEQRNKRLLAALENFFGGNDSASCPVCLPRPIVNIIFGYARTPELTWKLGQTSPLIFGALRRLSDHSVCYDRSLNGVRGMYYYNAYVCGDTPLHLGRHAWRVRLFVTGDAATFIFHFGVMEGKEGEPEGRLEGWRLPAFRGIRVSQATPAVEEQVVDFLLDLDAGKLTAVRLTGKQERRELNVAPRKDWLPYFHLMVDCPVHVREPGAAKKTLYDGSPYELELHVEGLDPLYVGGLES